MERLLRALVQEGDPCHRSAVSMIRPLLGRRARKGEGSLGGNCDAVIALRSLG